MLAHARGTALEFYLGLNHLMFNAGENRSPFLQSQTQLCRNICEELTLDHRRTLHCDRLAGNYRFGMASRFGALRTPDTAKYLISIISPLSHSSVGTLPSVEGITC